MNQNAELFVATTYRTRWMKLQVSNREFLLEELSAIEKGLSKIVIHLNFTFLVAHCNVSSAKYIEISSRPHRKQGILSLMFIKAYVKGQVSMATICPNVP